MNPQAQIKCTDLLACGMAHPLLRLPTQGTLSFSVFLSNQESCLVAIAMMNFGGISKLSMISPIGAEPENSGIQIFDLTRLDFLPRPEGPEPPTRGEVAPLEPDNVIRTIGASQNIITFQEEGKVLIVGFGSSFDDTSACNSEFNDCCCAGCGRRPIQSSNRVLRTRKYTQYRKSTTLCTD
mmetsp:Transcript_14155/g.30754  ORF Transcript_14155/g.30754 Transcript_14155/m.30754 type:complete len:181 (+) Transcript_14155:379-921(+)